MSSNKRVAKRERQLAHRQVSVTRSYHHSGPLPDPMTLQGYDQIVPGMADRIVKMAEDQSNHRKEMERIVIKSGSRDSLLGIIFGFILALVTLVAGAYLAFNGKEVGGAILGSSGLVGLVTAFIYGTRSNRKEREEKR